MRRGDVVVLHSPTHPGDRLVKRVVGEEGEEVETKGYHNWRVIVPSGHCWVEGDNLRASRDSNLFGPVSTQYSPVSEPLCLNYMQVSRGLILGRGTHIIWPLHRWRRLDSTLLPQQRDRVKIVHQQIT